MTHRGHPQGVLEELRYPLRVHLRWHGDDRYALSYLNSDAHRVQSAKIVPVMAFSVLIVGKKFVEGVALRRDPRRGHLLLPSVTSSSPFHPSASSSLPARSASTPSPLRGEELLPLREPSTTREVLCFASLSAPSRSDSLHRVRRLQGGHRALHAVHPGCAHDHGFLRHGLLLRVLVLSSSSTTAQSGDIKSLQGALHRDLWCSSPRRSTGSTSWVSSPCSCPPRTPSTSRARRPRPRRLPRLRRRPPKRRASLRRGGAEVKSLAPRRRR